jgi:cysteine-rich CPCC protein
MKKDRYTCPCCGYVTLSEWPGSYEICHVCFWEDDPVQILDPWFGGGANKPSLVQAQATYVAYGAMEQRFVANVKGILSGDVRDPEWRRVAEYDRRFARAPRDLSKDEHRELSAWYYWRRHAA